MRSRLFIGGRVEHHREHAQFVGCGDLAAAALHAGGLLVGADVSTERRNDHPVFVIEVIAHGAGELGEGLAALELRPRPIEDDLQLRIHGFVLGLELLEERGEFGCAASEQRPVEVVFFLVVPDEVLCDQAEVVLDEVAVARLDRVCERARQSGDLDAEQAVGELEPDHVWFVAEGRHGWFLLGRPASGSAPTEHGRACALSGT